MSVAFAERPTLVMYENQPPVRPASRFDPNAQQVAAREIWVRRFDERTPEEAVAEAAIGVQGVLLAAYSRRFEGDAPGQLPLGAFKEHRFDPENEERVRAQTVAMTGNMKAGSQYFIASTNDPRRHETPNIVGVAKITPSMPKARRVLQKAGFPAKPNMFLNDIVTAEERRGVGSILLGAAIDYGGYRPSAIMALHAFSSEPATNQWFFGLGLNAKRRLAKDFMVGSYALEEELLVSGRVTLRDIRANLAQKHPDIETAKRPK